MNILGLDWPTMGAVGAMIAVTWGLRAAGYLVLGRLPPTPFLRAFIAHLPGCLFVAFLAPALATGGGPALAGALAAGMAMHVARSVPLAMAAGVGTVWLIQAATT
jgi:uncharacterized membrane protein